VDTTDDVHMTADVGVSDDVGVGDVGDVDESLGEPVPFDSDNDLATRVAHARARHGRGGGMLAAGMLGLDQLVSGRKPREEVPVVVAANSDPLDIDTDGIAVRLEHVDVVAPPLPRTPLVMPSTHSGKRRRWR